MAEMRRKNGRGRRWLPINGLPRHAALLLAQGRKSEASVAEQRETERPLSKCPGHPPRTDGTLGVRAALAGRATQRIRRRVVRVPPGRGRRGAAEDAGLRVRPRRGLRRRAPDRAVLQPHLGARALLLRRQQLLPAEQRPGQRRHLRLRRHGQPHRHRPELWNLQIPCNSKRSRDKRQRNRHGHVVARLCE